MALLSPITLALAGLLAYRTYQGQGRLAEMLGRATPAPHQSGGGSASAQGDEGILSSLGNLFGGAGAGATLSGGLADLMKTFQQAGKGEVAQSWVDTGPNQSIAPSDIEKALGREKIEWLQEQTGMSREDLIAGLSRELPPAVDRLTPDGRLPNEQEVNQLVGGQSQQPEALATFAAAASRGAGKKPDDIGLKATADTAPIPTDSGAKDEAATRVLQEGVTGEDKGSAEAIDALPDRTEAARKNS